MACRITNLPDCIVDAFGDFLLSLVNAPIKPLLGLIQLLLTQPANIVVFGKLWAVIVYVISVFYGLFILSAGFNFVISGYSAERREQAKQWLQNVLLMIVSVQASYLVYSLLADVSSRLTAGVFGMIDVRFFLFSVDSVVTVGLEFFLGLLYVLVLLLTIVVFAVIYVCSSLGVVFFPFGLFFYFIPPLRDIGRFIINIVLMVLFLPFFSSLILLGVSLLQEGLESIKIILMIGAFALIDVLLVLLAIFSVYRAVHSVSSASVVKATVYLKQTIAPRSIQEKRVSDGYWRDSSRYGRF